MKNMSFGPVVAPLVGLALCVLVMQPEAVGRTELEAQFAARAVSVSGPEDAGPIEIFIERWSTDEEMNKLSAPLIEGYPGQLLPTLEEFRVRAGVVLMPGVQARGLRVRGRTPKNLMFARQITTAAGRRIIAASYEHLGLGEMPLDARREFSEFNLIDIRFAPDGSAGVGKVVGVGDVTYSSTSKVLELRNYAAQPVRLTDVKPEKETKIHDARR